MLKVDKETQSRELTLRELLLKVASIFIFLKTRWKKIFLASFIGAIIGFLYALLTPVQYVAKLTFVVEESKGGVGGLSALAGQFGFDIGGSGGGGVFAGDNILLFLKSENLCRQTLLTSYDKDGKTTLADRYAEAKKLKRKWEKDEDIGKISFAKYANREMPRLEDSLLQLIIKKHILKTDLFVTKPDKKSSFIQVAVATRDEKLSAFFVQRLVDIATAKYVESKLKVKQSNVNMLQRRADSLAAILNEKTYRSASSQQVLVDANPALKTATTFAEISTREKSMVATIFAEVVKNLEIAKSILSQETPAIQMVDQSSFPLEKMKLSKTLYTALWGFLFATGYVIFILFKKWLRGVR